MLLLNIADKKLLFFDTSNLKYLSKIENIFIDGTFSYAPKYFQQLFMICGVENGSYVVVAEWYVPFILCLLPNKKEITITNFFHIY